MYELPIINYHGNEITSKYGNSGSHKYHEFPHFPRKTRKMTTDTPVFSEISEITTSIFTLSSSQLFFFQSDNS